MNEKAPINRRRYLKNRCEANISMIAEIKQMLNYIQSDVKEIQDAERVSRTASVIEIDKQLWNVFRETEKLADTGIARSFDDEDLFFEKFDKVED